MPKSLLACPDGPDSRRQHCWADATAGSFTVPATILSALPPSYSDSTGPHGTLHVIQNYQVSAFVPTGTDYGGTLFGDTISQGNVAFQ